MTGGGRGIGRAIALSLASVGFDIWLNYKANHRAAEGTRDEILKLGRRCTLLCFDVADPDATASRLGPVAAQTTPYVLVNNAGMAKDSLMVWMGFEEWRTVLAAVLDGFFLVTKTVLPGMLARKSGRIVNISSTSGQAGRPGQVNYAAAKAGLIGATKALATEVARRGVLVNAVAPGLIKTEMTADLPMDKILPAVPLGRVGTAEEVAAIVTFLCSNEAGYMTGQIIGCNGGLYV